MNKSSWHGAGVALGALALICAGCGSNGSSSANGVYGFDAGGTSMDGGASTDGGMATDGGTGATMTVTETDLVSDGNVAGTTKDTNLINPWGLAAGPMTPFWVADNGSGFSTVYNGMGMSQNMLVTIPAANGATAGNKGTPTGVVFNGTATNFNGDTFIFATEDGTIAGWQSGSNATIRATTSGAVYKGLAIVGNVLYAANFNSGELDRFDATYKRMGALSNAMIPSGFAPFNVANLNDKLYIAYARQDATKKNDVAGTGNGLIAVLDPATGTTRTLVSSGALNSPWGMVLAPAGFGSAGNDLLVGNFGDGLINVYDPMTGASRGQLTKSGGGALSIDGLWGLSFGNGAAAGSQSSLFFTAGPGAKQHGLFGKLDVAP